MSRRPIAVVVLAIAALGGAAAHAEGQPQSQDQLPSQAQAAPDSYRDQRALPNANDPQAREALLRARGEAYRRASDAQQNPEEVRTTQALNAEIAAQNELADQADAAARLDHEAAVARYDLEVRSAEAQAQRQAETARTAQEQYDRDYSAWREQIRLCRAGFREACTAQPAWVRP